MNICCLVIEKCTKKNQTNESTEYLIKSKGFFFCIHVSSSTLLTDLSWMKYDRLFYMTKSRSGKIILFFISCFMVNNKGKKDNENINIYFFLIYAKS